MQVPTMEQVLGFIGWEPEESTFSDGVNQLFEGGGKIYSVMRRETLKFLAKTPIEQQAGKVNTFVNENVDIIFAAMALYSAYQQAFMFIAGAVCGLLLSQSAVKFGLTNKEVTLITDRQNKTESTYLQMAVMLAVQPWVSSFINGFVAGNYMGTTMVPPKQSATALVADMAKRAFAEIFF